MFHNQENKQKRISVAKQRPLHRSSHLHWNDNDKHPEMQITTVAVNQKMSATICTWNKFPLQGRKKEKKLLEGRIRGMLANHADTLLLREAGFQVVQVEKSVVPVQTRHLLLHPVSREGSHVNDWQTMTINPLAFILATSTLPPPLPPLKRTLYFSSPEPCSSWRWC